LLEQFNLLESALYKVNGPVNLVRMNGLIDLADAPRLRFAPFTPAWPASLPRQKSMFDRIRASDLMLHQPFESFEPVVQFMREAVADPAVLAIKQTIYRAGSESPLMDLLIEAARRGKEVMAVVELQARFDEEANINWAERLEAVGAQVVYGVVGLKTHGKLLLVTRREDGRPAPLRPSLHRQLQPEHRPALHRHRPFHRRSGADRRCRRRVPAAREPGRTRTMRAMLQAPFTLHKQMLAELARVAARGHGRAAGAGGRQDQRPDRRGADRGAGRRRPGRRRHRPDRARRVHAAPRRCRRDRADPGALDRRPLPRALAHRLLPLGHGSDDEALYLSSADWMGRNMFGRIEVAWPVREARMRQRIIDECLVPYLLDGEDAWTLAADGSYSRVAGPGPSAQQALMRRYAGREGLSILNRL
jgi:polyphosphate kinase